ncbi:DUF1826 domain-containing protein [Marinomonas sp. THO17]|uniref:DUF1826 domain-containing protein n=1 Tax=Marinomonas sp. THO17 TaxID=3149048 RepID=UPI00336BB994
MPVSAPLKQVELSAANHLVAYPLKEGGEEQGEDSVSLYSEAVSLSVAKARHREILGDIYQPQIGMAIWQRPLGDAFDYAQSMITAAPHFSFKGQQTPQLAAKLLEKLLPQARGKSAFIEDVTLLMEMFACLFDLEDVGLRLDVLSKAMCPRFHVDKIPCRLITTYAGAGSEWLHEAHVQRTRLGRGGDAKDHNSGLLHQGRINCLKVGDVALMKGDDWPASQGRGMVHRSPAASSEQSRLFLSLDMV